MVWGQVGGLSWLWEALGRAFTSTLRYHQESTYVRIYARPPPNVLRVERWATQGLGGVAFVSGLGLVAVNLERLQK